MNKNILITGSTDGIGKLVALKLANDGHHVYLHGRNLQKLNTVIKEIKTASNNDTIDGFTADFSDLNAVHAMAQAVQEKVPHIDILINNAGIFKSPVATTAQGLDIRFAVNYLAPYMLTNALLPILKKSNEARVINLSSAAQASVSIDALAGNTSISVNEAYAQSKLALTMWTFAMANKVNEVAMVAVNPGSLLNTKMVQEAYGQHWSSADKGRDILYRLAILDKAAQINGAYFDNDHGNYGKAHADAYDSDKIEQLIKRTEQLVGSY